MRRLAVPALRLATLLAVALVVAPARAGAQSGDADGDGLPNAWEVQFGLDPLSAVGDDGAAGAPAGDGRSNLEELASGTHPRGTWSRSFAEGATGPLFDLRFALFNTHPTTSARVLMRFLTSEGAVVPHVLVLAPLARVTVDPETLPGLQATAVSTVLEADTVVVVDRTMSWDATHYGSHAETGVAAPSQSWFLAEGATHSGFTLYYLLQNPGATPAAVTVTYLLPSGQPLERTYAVAPRSRFNILVNREDAALAATDVSASITSDVPIVVERAMYLDARGQHFGAGHASAGVTAPATQWLLAEGATGPFFDLFVLVANPGPQDAGIAEEPTMSTMRAPQPRECNGELTQQQIVSGVGPARSQVRQCYERRLKVNNVLQGTVNVAVLVDRDGSIDQMRVGGSLRDNEVFACVRRIVEGWRFPPPSGGCVQVNVPFALSPQQ